MVNLGLIIFWIWLLGCSALLLICLILTPVSALLRAKGLKKDGSVYTASGDRAYDLDGILADELAENVGLFVVIFVWPIALAGLVGLLFRALLRALVKSVRASNSAN